MFGKKPKIGKEIEDTKNEYFGDRGTISDFRVFQRVGKEYVVVLWDEKSKHGGGYRNYKKEDFGQRFRYI